MMLFQNFVYFNGNAVPCPDDFSMEIEDNIVSELKTMSGKILADVNGWRYSDTTLKWDSLPNDYLTTLLSNSVGNFTFKFKNHSGTDTTVNAFRRGRVQTQTRFKDNNGNIMWKDVRLKLTFPDSYR